MLNKMTKEWNISSPWGQIALISWGDYKKTPVLLIHGFMDSAATFLLLIEHLPEGYYYVGFDLPGHGQSQPLPKGLMVTHLHMVEVVKRVVKHLKWDHFICLTHSMAIFIATYYNCIYPGKITKLINIDPRPAFDAHYFTSTASHTGAWMRYIYDKYQDNYISAVQGKSYTYQEAVNVIMQSRKLTQKQAEAVLSRSLISEKNGLFKFSWEPRMKRFAIPTLSKESLVTIIAQNPVPTFNVLATNRKFLIDQSAVFSNNILQELKKILNEIVLIEIDGGHDVHLTKPEAVADEITEYLNRTVTKSKL